MKNLFFLNWKMKFCEKFPGCIRKLMIHKKYKTSDLKRDETYQSLHISDKSLHILRCLPNNESLDKGNVFLIMFQ